MNLADAKEPQVGRVDRLHRHSRITLGNIAGLLGDVLLVDGPLRGLAHLAIARAHVVGSGLSSPRVAKDGIEAFSEC